MRRAPALAALLATGCAPCLPLDAVPIGDGGGVATADQIAAVRRGLDQAAAWLGAESTCLRSVDFLPGDLLGESNGISHGGLYYPWNQRVVVSLAARAADLPEITRHEVCHAWDFHHGSPWSAHATALASYT